MMQNTRLTLILVILTMLAPMMGCGIDTNPFPGSSDGFSESPTDMGGESASDGAPNTDADGANETDGVDTSTSDPETSGCEMSEEGREPYTMFHADTRRLLIGHVGSVASESSVEILDTTGTKSPEPKQPRTVPSPSRLRSLCLPPFAFEAPLVQQLCLK